MSHIELAATGGLTDVEPVGCLVAGSSEAIGLDKGLQQHRTVAVSLLPIGGSLTGDAAEDLGGQSFRLHPGQDEKARVVDDQMHVAAPLLFGPADELIPRSGFPGGRAKAQQGHELAIDRDEVAQLRARQGVVAEVVARQSR